MAELSKIETPILPTAQLKNIDYSQAYISVGNELNKRYWENRKMYLEGVMQPLAKVEADEFGQKALADIKSEIEARARVFEESGTWHEAGNFIFNEVQNIVTNPILKEVIKSKANYDAFVKNVNESNWSTSDKNGFMLRAHHASSNITTDANGMVIGGFTPISIGESYDLSKYSLDVLDKISKIKEDKVNVSKIINDPKALEAYGLPSIVDNDGKTLISHIVEQTFERETVTADDLANVAQQIVVLNPEVQKQIFETETNSFYTKYYDKSNRTFKDVPNDTIYKSLGYKFYNTSQRDNNVKRYIENDLNLNPSTFLIKDVATGVYQFNHNKIENFNKKNIECQAKFGIPIEHLYTEKIDDLLRSRVAREYSNDLLNSLNLTLDNKELINELIINTNVTNAWKDYIENITGTAISLYAYNHIKTSNNFIDNPAYTAYLKNYYKYSLKPGDIYNPNSPSSVDENGLIDYTNFLSSNLESINKLSEDINKIKVNNDQIITDLTSVNNPKLVELGFIKNGKIDESALQQVDLSELDKAAIKGKYYNTANYQDIRNSIINLRANKEKINDIIRLQESYKFNAQTLYNDYNKEAKKAKENGTSNYYHGMGYYGIFSDTARFIADHNITSVEEFKDAVKRLKRISVEKDPYANTYYTDDKGNVYDVSPHSMPGKTFKPNASDEEIQKEISNVLDNLKNRYEKKTGKPFQWAQQSFSITNPNYTLQSDLEVRKAAWRGGSGSLQVIALADGSDGNKLVPGDIASLIGLNQFPVSIKTNEKGDTITEKNIHSDNSTPIKKEAFKTKDDIYKTEIRYSLNPAEQSQGYIAYDIICYDKSNSYCGTVKVREKSGEVNDYLLNVYEQFKPLADVKNSQGEKAVGVVISNTGEISYKFESEDSQPAEGLTELKYNIENMYNDGKNGYTYTLNINQLYSNAEIIDPINIKIIKVSDGYIIEDLSGEQGIIKLPEKYRESFKKLGLKDTDLKWNGQKVFTTLDLAFVDLSNFNLQLSSILRKLNKSTK